MSNRFKSLALNDNKNDKTNNKKKDNVPSQNVFKNRFNILNEESEKKETKKEVKETKNTRFDSLLVDEEIVQKPIKEPISYKNVIVREPVNIIINKVVEEEKQEPIIFESLIKTNITTSKPATILNFKDKLLTEEQIIKPVIEQIVKPVIVTDNEYKKAKRERKAITNVMCKIVTDMVANGERQRRFYDSIYGQGAYDYEYEKIIDKYEVLYGKDSWFDGEEGECWLDVIYESDENNVSSDEYEYTNGTIDNDNNRYKWL